MTLPFIKLLDEILVAISQKAESTESAIVTLRLLDNAKPGFARWLEEVAAIAKDERVCGAPGRPERDDSEALQNILAVPEGPKRAGQIAKEARRLPGNFGANRRRLYSKLGAKKL